MIEQDDKLKQRARELAIDIAKSLPHLKTFDGKPIVFDWHRDFAHRICGYITTALADVRREEARRWYKEFVEPWRADDLDTDDKARAWLAALERGAERREVGK